MMALWKNQCRDTLLAVLKEIKIANKVSGYKHMALSHLTKRLLFYRLIFKK